MSQNIYDDPGFFAGYSTLRRSREGLDGAPEWPALRAMLPPLAGREVLDLGCGFGWFCRWAAGQGAARVHGVDLSENMLARARETPMPGLDYARADLETIAPPPASFDLVYSSLALHYVSGLPRLLRAIRTALRPDGAFVFSVEHPIFMAPSTPRWIEGPGGGAVWPLDRYLVEGERRTDWFADGVVKHHRTIGTWFAALGEAGFALERLVEWVPSDAQVAETPEWARERDRPMFLLLAARPR